jgi:hypothetical protein
MHGYKRTYIETCIHIRRYIKTYMHTYTYIHIFMQVYMNAYIYAYLHTYIHAHTYTTPLYQLHVTVLMLQLGQAVVRAPGYQLCRRDASTGEALLVSSAFLQLHFLNRILLIPQSSGKVMQLVSFVLSPQTEQSPLDLSLQINFQSVES